MRTTKVKFFKKYLSEGMSNPDKQCCQLGTFPVQWGWYRYEAAGIFWSLRVAVFWATFCLKLRVLGQCSTGRPTSSLNMNQLGLDPFFFFF